VHGFTFDGLNFLHSIFKSHRIQHKFVLCLQKLGLIFAEQNKYFSLSDIFVSPFLKVN